MALLDNTLNLFLLAAPWLLLGLLLAGLIRAWIPEELMTRWLGGSGLWQVTKAALLGAPIPLCSCGVVPAALSLRRSGASKGSTMSFLIATPETGVDSVAISYALLGPFMALLRPIAALTSAIGVGIATNIVDQRASRTPDQHEHPPQATCCHCEDSPAPAAGWLQGVGDGLRYAVTDILDEIVPWMIAGLLIAGAVLTLVPPTALAEAGSGIIAKVVIFAMGIPMYICATASTPLAASLLLAGISPGTVLVFLLAGPATNIATLGIVRREFGKAIFLTYFVGMAVSSIGLGMVVDYLVQTYAINIAAQIGTSATLFPSWFQVACLIVLLFLTLRPLRRLIFDKVSRAV